MNSGRRGAASARSVGIRRRFGRGYRRVVTRSPWAVVAFWVAAVTAAVTLAPAHAAGGGFGDFLPDDHPILQAQQRVLQQFRVPVVAGTTVVVHQPDGLSC